MRQNSCHELIQLIYKLSGKKHRDQTPLKYRRCKSFHVFFANIGKKLNQKLVSCEISLTNQQSELMFYLKTNQNENLAITQKPKSKYSEGYSNLQNFFLKKQYLIHSFNNRHSLRFLTFVCRKEFLQILWKMASVISLQNSGDMSDINNYRPYLTVSNAWKKVEKVLLIRIVSYIDHFKLFDLNQIGIR